MLVNQKHRDANEMSEFPLKTEQAHRLKDAVLKLQDSDFVELRAAIGIEEPRGGILNVCDSNCG